MSNESNNGKIALGPIASFSLLVLAAYGAGTAGMQVANIVTKGINKSA
jgi:hypothetical protein